MGQTKLKTVEFDGFKFDFDPDCVDDMEFLELTDKVENEGDITKYPALVKLLLGEDTYKAACEHFKAKYGRFSATKCSELFKKAIQTADPKE